MSKPVKTVEIVGIKYRRKAYEDAAVEVGDYLLLRWDLKNEHDPWAIAVYKNKQHIGYVPRNETWVLHRYRECQVRLLVKVIWCDELACKIAISAESDPEESPVEFDCITA